MRDLAQGKNYADRRDGLSTFRIRLRIRAMLRAWGPMRTERILNHLKDYPEALCRMVLQIMLEAGEIVRPITKQLWRLRS